MIWFDYSVLKYSPDKVRGEVINIGLVVFKPDGVDVRLLNTSHKPKMFDNNSNFESIQKLEHSIKSLCALVKDTDKQHAILKNLSSTIFVAGKSSFSIAHVSDYEKRVVGLFDKLVKPYSGRKPSVYNSRLHVTLRNQFKKLDLLAKEPSDIDDHKVVPHYAISGGSGLTVDFMLKNGKFHMTEAIDFDLNDPQAKFKETTMKIMTFIEGKRTISEDVGCYLVYNASAEREREITQHLNLAGDYSDKIYNVASTDEKAAYFELISNLAGTGLHM